MLFSVPLHLNAREMKKLKDQIVILAQSIQSLLVQQTTKLEASVKSRPYHHQDALPVTEFTVSLPEFHGNGEPQTCLGWLHTCEKILEFRDIPTDRRVALAAKHLRQCASNWYHHLKPFRSCHCKTKIIAWHKFTEHITRKFISTNYTQHQNLHQKPLTLALPSLGRQKTTTSLLKPTDTPFAAQIEIV